MHYPPKFDAKKAVELGKLVKQAYQRFQDYKKGTPWKLQGNYTFVSEISYRTLMSFDPTDPEAGLTAIDKEVAIEMPVSYSLDSMLGRDIPMGFVATSKDKKEVYLVFRGTVSVREWLFDLNIKVQTYGQDKWGCVSDGFLTIYNRCRESFLKNLTDLAPDPQLYITGHSLGGALSLLALPDVIRSTPFKKPILYNFGCPRLGDNDFVTAYNALPFQKTFRVVNTSDLVTSIPLPAAFPLVPSGNYSHVDTPVDFTVQKNDISANHSMDTYIAALGG
jgi:triacylglycerol lipase